MASPTIEILTKDTWVPVLTNVTYFGKVFIVPQENEPTRYLSTMVEAGDPAPDPAYVGGVPFRRGVAPTTVDPMDMYIKAVDYDGKVEVYT
jgi:hypothetical protein